MILFAVPVKENFFELLDEFLQKKISENVRNFYRKKICHGDQGIRKCELGSGVSNYL